MTNSSQNFMTLEEFIKFAIQKEIEAAQFYGRLYKQATRAETREVALLLEKEEVKHQKVLREFDIGANKGGFLQFPPSFSLSMPDITSENPGVDEIIEIAIARERKAVEIYGKVADMVSGKFKQLLIGLTNFEKQHVEKLLSLQALF
jgi:rubrerythrin